MVEIDGLDCFCAKEKKLAKISLGVLILAKN
jgi:hypothetical protein